VSVTYAVGGSGTTPGSGSTGGDPSTNGYDGIVIISYLGPQRATGGNVTSAGGRTIHSFTSNGTFTVV